MTLQTNPSFVPTIEEIVEEFKETFATAHRFEDGVLVTEVSYIPMVRMTDWLTQTLKDYGDAVRAELLDQLGVVRGEDAKRLNEMLNNPPKPTKYLIRAWKRYSKMKGNNEAK